MSIEQFIQLVQANGVIGLVVGLLVLGVIYVARFSGLIKNGNVARVVNVVLSILFGGFQFGDDGSAIVTVIASLLSSLLFTLISGAARKWREARR